MFLQASYPAKVGSCPILMSSQPRRLFLLRLFLRLLEEEGVDDESLLSLPLPPGGPGGAALELKVHDIVLNGRIDMDGIRGADDDSSPLPWRAWKIIWAPLTRAYDSSRGFLDPNLILGGPGRLSGRR